MNPVRRRARQDPQFAARRQGLVRPARHRQQLDGRDSSPAVSSSPCPSSIRAFKLDPGISTYGGTIYWNDELRTFDRAGRQADGRADQRQCRGAVSTARSLRAERAEGAGDVGPGAGQRDQAQRQARAFTASCIATIAIPRWRISSTICSASAAISSPMPAPATSPSSSTARPMLKALEFYLRLGEAGGFPNPGSVSQGQMIQLMAAGKTAHTVGVVGAWAQFDDPEKSAVVGKLDAALIPAARAASMPAGPATGSAPLPATCRAKSSSPRSIPRNGSRPTTTRSPIPASARCRCEPISRDSDLARGAQVPLPEGAGRELQGGARCTRWCRRRRR